MSIKAREMVILSFHQLHNNELDNLTRVMMEWPVEANNKSYYDMVNSYLTRMDSRLNLRSLLRLPYPQAKQVVKATAFKFQMTEWKSKDQKYGYLTSYQGRSKPCWGIEQTLYSTPHWETLSYIRLRNLAVELPLDSDGLCKFCHSPASIPHIVWACPSMSTPRDKFAYLV